MSSPTFHHLTWSKTEVPRHRHNLADSAAATPDLEALGLPHQAGLAKNSDRVLAELGHSLGLRLSAPSGRVLVTAGGSEANACVFGALVRPGEEVLVETPGYEPHYEAPRVFGIAVRRFTRPLGDAPDLAAAVESTLSERTRMIVVSHLHNPSGLPLAPQVVAGLERLASSRGLWILCDEIFRDLAPGPLGTHAAQGPRWVATGSLTKAYGLGGLRIGWIAASEEVLARAEQLQNAFSAVPALPSATLALALVPHLDRLRTRAHEILATNRARWLEFLARRPVLGPWTASQGTTTWCQVGGDRGDAFSEFASRRFDLAVVPGRFFGDPAGIRVGLGRDPASFAAALEVFGRAVMAFEAARPPSGGRGAAEVIQGSA